VEVSSLCASVIGAGDDGESQLCLLSAEGISLINQLQPDTSVPPGDTKVKDASLRYNEYICYDVAQVRLRYLFRIRM